MKNCFKVLFNVSLLSLFVLMAIPQKESDSKRVLAQQKKVSAVFPNVLFKKRKFKQNLLKRR